MINDLLESPTSEDRPTAQIELIARILPFAEFSSDHEPRLAIGRSNRLWIISQSDERLNRKWLEFSDAFASKYGVSIPDMAATLLQLYCTAMNFEPGRDNWRNHLVINCQEYFSHSKLPEDIARKIMRAISITPRDLAIKMFHSPRQSELWDFTIFRRYPYLEVDDGIFRCYDCTFLLSMLTDGLFWLIDSALTRNQREGFKTFFGSVFENYVHSTLRSRFGIRSPLLPRYYPSPKFENTSDQICDALIDTGDLLILIEVKGSLLTPRAKYSGDPDALNIDIRDKFARPRKDKGGGQKGIYQLQLAINKLIGGASVGIPDFDIHKCKSIVPVMVCYDEALGAPGVRSLLNSLLYKDVVDKPEQFPKLHQLVIVTTRELECLSAITRKRWIGDIFIRFEREGSGHTSFYNYLCHAFNDALDFDSTLIQEDVEAAFRLTGKRIHEIEEF